MVHVEETCKLEIQHMWDARSFLPLFIYSLYPICERTIEQTDECVGRLYRLQILFLSRRFTAAVVCEQKAGEYLIADLLTRPVFKPFSRRGLSVRDRDPWWLLISYLPVVMYIQFVELQGCSVKVVVTLLLRLLHRASSSLEQTFGGKKVENILSPSPPFLFPREICDRREIFVIIWD